MRKAILAVLMLGISIAAPSEVAHAGALVQPTNQTDCGQSAAYGTRVCFDHTTAYGPVILIYTSGTTLWGSFGVIDYASAWRASIVPSDLDWSPGSWSGYPNITSVGNPNGASVFESIDANVYACADPNHWARLICTYSSANHDLLEWFSASSGYEFITVN